MKSMAILLVCGCALAQNRPGGSMDTTIANVANLPAQKISANDLIAVSVYDSPELTRTIRVGAEGAIRFPMLKQRIQVEGLMPAQVETAIAEELKAEEILVDPMVTVTIMEYDSRPISVVGAVKRPTTFQAVGKVTLIDALAKAEGLTMDAGPDLLLTVPQPGDGPVSTSLVKRIPIKALIDNAEPELNVRLTGGEEIRVPEARKIYVVGNVKKPGAFPVRDGSESTVLKLLAMVEGVAPYAAKEAYIYRAAADGLPRQEIQLPLTRLLERRSPDVPLMADDILYIPDNKTKRAGLTALEKILIYGSGAAAAMIYAGVR
jgi:polysaccharide export outer membrane protein